MEKSSKTESLAQQVAKRLELALHDHAPARLAPTRTLARQYNVSGPVITEALRILALKGLIIIKPRSRAWIAARVGKVPLAVEQVTSAERLYRLIVKRISSGEYPCGRLIPKYNYFVVQEKVSPATVRAAMRRLLNEGIVCRTGKRYAAGAPNQASPRVSFRQCPTIMVFTALPHQWSHMSENVRVKGFCSNFMQEATRVGIRLEEATASERGHMRHHFMSTRGRQAILDRIASLEGWYLGTVMATRDDFGEFNEWARLFMSFGRPVVWFDSTGKDLTTPVASPLFTRCHYSEAQACRTALQALHGAGHRTVAYLYTDTQGWQERRLSVLQKIAEEFTPVVRLRSCRHASIADWMNPGSSGVLGKLDDLYRRASPQVRSDLEALIGGCDCLTAEYPECLPREASRSRWAGIATITLAHNESPEVKFHPMWPAVERIWSALTLYALTCDDNPVTALIAPNDRIAHGHHLRWLASLGLRIPDDVSIISFDNLSPAMFMSLTTIDMGFSYLGYQAFHAILRDIPVDRDRRGNIAMMPTIVDCGSVDKPGRGIRSMAQSSRSRQESTR